MVHLETSGAPVLDEAGNLAGYRGADTDVTERKRAEEELRQHRDHLEEMVKEQDGGIGDSDGAGRVGQSGQERVSGQYEP